MNKYVEIISITSHDSCTYINFGKPIMFEIGCFSGSLLMVTLLGIFIFEWYLDFHTVGTHKTRCSHEKHAVQPILGVSREVVSIQSALRRHLSTRLWAHPRKEKLEQLQRRAMKMIKWLENCLSEERSVWTGPISYRNMKGQTYRHTSGTWTVINRQR